ncbi:MAG: hypothetical protein ACFB4J_04095 [Elainellaceae cyanobacterium]
MRQAQLISIAAVALLGLTGCNALQRLLPGGQNTSSEPDPTVEIGNGEAGTAQGEGTLGETTQGDGEGTLGETTSAEGESTAIASASTPSAAEDSAPVGTVPLDLITSTNPDTRAQQVQRDRPDPFSLLPSAPTVEVPETTTQPATTQPASTSPSTAEAGESSQPEAGASSSPSAGDGAAGPVVPLPPPTTLARAVEITGVVQIGAVPYAIVRAPNEPTSRYVRAGQSLSNGAVLVKRIDSFAGLEPVVVLEQNGVEVVRNVEGEIAPSDETETARAESSRVG